MTTPLNRRELLAGLLASAPAAMLAFDSFASEPAAANPPAGPAVAKLRVLVTISKETTYITEPLRRRLSRLRRRVEPALPPRRDAREQRRRAILESGRAATDPRGTP